MAVFAPLNPVEPIATVPATVPSLFQSWNPPLVVVLKQNVLPILPNELGFCVKEPS
jgi:hypothetical protein